MPNFSSSPRQSFIVSQAILEQLDAVFAERIGPTTYAVTCADDVSRSFGSLEELLRFDNGPSRRITKLIARSENREPYRAADVGFSDSQYSPISITVTAEEETVLSVRSRVLDIVRDAKPWYNIAATLDYVMVSLIVFFGFIIMAGAVVVMTGSTSTSSDDDELRGSLLSLILIGGTFATGLGLNWLRDRLFPIGTFSIGAGIERDKRHETIRFRLVLFAAFALLTILLRWIIW